MWSLGNPTQHIKQPNEQVLMNTKTAIVAWCTSDEDKQSADRLISSVGDGACSFLLSRKEKGLEVAECRGIPGPSPVHFETVQEAWDWIRTNMPERHIFIEAKLNNADLPPDAPNNFLKRCSTAETEKDMVSNFINHTDAFFSYSSSGNSADDIRQGFLFVGPNVAEVNYYMGKNTGENRPAPKVICLDLSPQCVKRCAKCHFHAPGSPFSKHIPKREQMPFDMAVRLMEEAAEFTPKPVIAPTFSGEPLLYPRLLDIAQKARELGLSFSITTNAMLLSPEIAKKLVDLEVQTVMVSLDAADSETYRTLQAPGDLEKVKHNIRHLIKIRKDTTPNVALTYVIEETNQNEFDAFLKEWSDVDYIVRSHKLDTLKNGAKAILPRNAIPPETVPCVPSLSGLYVRYDGRISLCGYDLKADNVPLKAGGALNLKQIWESEEMEKVRTKMLNPPYSYGYCLKGSCREGQYLWETTEKNHAVTISPISKVYKSSKMS